jgi:predicted TPR repeat methyltransferase
MSASRAPAYFEALYAKNPDPWGFETSPYEAEKYAATLAALRGRHFNAAFEAGCSIGVLTHMLAPRCARLLAVDCAPLALAKAKTRCARYPQVRCETRTLPQDWPDATFDLILLSEVLYFLSPADIIQTAARAQSSLTPGGMMVLVNFTGAIDEPINGDIAAEIFVSAVDKSIWEQRRAERFRIDVLQ